jgi:hypothetical protein
MKFIPRFGSRRTFERLGDEFIPARHGCAAAIAHTTCEHIKEEETARHLPATQVSNAGAAPDVRSKFAVTIGDIFCRFLNAIDGHLRFF